MAGEWIKWTKGLHRKREVLMIAARMSLPAAHVAGLCMVLWEWLDDNLSADQIENGNAHVTLGALQPEFLDALVGASGFAAALAAVGWMNVRSGSLVVPNYSRHNGQTAKDRALTAERVAKTRFLGASKCNARTVTNVTPPPLPEKRREEVNTGSLSRETPTIEAVLASAALAGVPKNVAESFFHGCEARPLSPSGAWTSPDGSEMRNWQSALKKYAISWQSNDQQRTQQKHGSSQRPGAPSVSRNEGTANAGKSSQYAGVGKV